MAPFRCFTVCVYAVLFILTYSNLAHAITAKKLMTGMNKDERNGYISGLVDMLSYQAVLTKDRPRARCINDSFYRNDAMLKRVVDAMYAFSDKEPVAILIVVMNKACKA